MKGWESESKRNKTKSAQTFPNVFEDPFKLQFALVPRVRAVIAVFYPQAIVLPRLQRILCVSTYQLLRSKAWANFKRWSVKFEFQKVVV